MDLQRRIHNFLESRHYPGLRNLLIAVCGGQVVISGRVQSFHEKQLATNCAQRVAGVLQVINDVHVVPPAAIEDKRLSRQRVAR